MEEEKITGYITLIEPRTRRGLIEYRLRIVTLGGERITAYIRAVSYTHLTLPTKRIV